MTAQLEEKKLSFNVDIGKIREGGLFIATPMYGGMCTGAYAKSILNLSALCAQHNIPLKTHFIYNESLIQRARNYCADEFMRSGLKQMVFIDADIEFSPSDILILAHLQNEHSEYDVLCGPYPKKSISWEKIIKAVEKGVADNDPEILENFVGDFVFNTPPGVSSFKINEPAEVLESGTGFMFIRKETFEKFREAYPEKSYKPDHIRTSEFDGSREITAFFDCVIDPETKRYLSEDYYFCQAVRKAGMKVWLAPWMQLKHYGTFMFGGSLAALASVGASATTDKSALKKKK